MLIGKALARRPPKGMLAYSKLPKVAVFAPGEPAREPNLERPDSVWSAIQAFKKHHPDVWHEMGRDLFALRRRCDTQKIMAQGVLWHIEESNTVEVQGPGEPLLVWIDKAGKYKLPVHLAFQNAAAKSGSHSQPGHRAGEVNNGKATKERGRGNSVRATGRERRNAASRKRDRSAERKPRG